MGLRLPSRDKYKEFSSEDDSLEEDYGWSGKESLEAGGSLKEQDRYHGYHLAVEYSCSKLSDEESEEEDKMSNEDIDNK